MKAFLASLAILAVLLACSVLNCMYVEKITDGMLELESSFPEKQADGKSPPAEAIAKAEELWSQSSRRLLHFAKAGYVNSVTNALKNVQSYYSHGSISDYLAARAILKEAIRSLADAEAFSIGSII